MVRKRDHYTRARAKRGRPKTPARTDGWVIADLSRITTLPIRTLRYYLERGLIEPLEFRGTATRYSRRELLRVLGIIRIQAETRASLSDIKRRLDELSTRELEDWLRTQPLPPTVTEALGIQGPGPTVRSSEALPTMANTAMWQRITLLPGLELLVAAAASPAVQRAARSIYADYVGEAPVRADDAVEVS